MCTSFALQDWWWKARLAKCYYQMGLLRDAEQQLKSSLKNQVCYCACTVYTRRSHTMYNNLKIWHGHGGMQNSS